MYELSVSLTLVLNMCELKEAITRKRTANVCLTLVGLIVVACAVYECHLAILTKKEHYISEALGVATLCLIYFSTIVELLRKLRIFVLEQSKREARLCRTQAVIFFIAYGSKVGTLLFWIHDPPQDRSRSEQFLINSDIMTLIWIVVPVIFILCMQIRSYKQMRAEQLYNKNQ